MAGAVENFRSSLQEHNIDPILVAQIMRGYEGISDRSTKVKKVEFFMQAMKRMDELLDYETRYRVRDTCACCTGGWREKAVSKLATETADKNLDEKIQALQQLTHMGSPVLNPDNTITAGIGGEEGCSCACSIFSGAGSPQLQQPVSSTYCLCCGGHFRYHYQIALGVKLRTKEVLSTALESLGKKPCRFVYEMVD